MANEVSEVSTARVPRLRFWFVEQLVNISFEYFWKFRVSRSRKLGFNLIVLQAASDVNWSLLGQSAEIDNAWND